MNKHNVIIQQPFVSDSDKSYTLFENQCNYYSSHYEYELAESNFLITKANTADNIIRKLEIAEFYLDTSCYYEDRDVIRIVISLVRKGEIDDALHYSRAVVDNEFIESYCANPIKSAISDLESIDR